MLLSNELVWQVVYLARAVRVGRLANSLHGHFTAAVELSVSFCVRGKVLRVQNDTYNDDGHYSGNRSDEDGEEKEH